MTEAAASAQRCSNYTLIECGATTADYLTTRIARDHPDIRQRMQAGTVSQPVMCSMRIDAD
jgi:hypothetical protein